MDIILNNYIDTTLFCRFTFRLPPSPATLTVSCVCARRMDIGELERNVVNLVKLTRTTTSLRSPSETRNPSFPATDGASSLSHYKTYINIARMQVGICIAIRAEFVFLRFKKSVVLSIIMIFVCLNNNRK